MNLVIGNQYNFKYQDKVLVYLGKEGSWHQFADIQNPPHVWAEVLTEDLRLLEESVNKQ